MPLSLFKVIFVIGSPLFKVNKSAYRVIFCWVYIFVCRFVDNELIHVVQFFIFFYFLDLLHVVHYSTFRDHHSFFWQSTL